MPISGPGRRPDRACFGLGSSDAFASAVSRACVGPSPQDPFPKAGADGRIVTPFGGGVHSITLPGIASDDADQLLLNSPA